MNEATVPLWLVTFGTMLASVPAASKADAIAIVEGRLRAHGISPKRGEVAARRQTDADAERLRVIGDALAALPGRPNRY